jgi:hypothetical protein
MAVRVTIRIDASKVVQVTEDHGGFLAGKCFACGASGWLEGRGYPHRAKDVPGSHLRHGASCPMNRALNNDGSLRQS